MPNDSLFPVGAYVTVSQAASDQSGPSTLLPVVTGHTMAVCVRYTMHAVGSTVTFVILTGANCDNCWQANGGHVQTMEDLSIDNPIIQ